MVIIGPQPVNFYFLFTFLVICERQRALYGIKCVLRIFLTNMASHTDG